MEDKLSKVLKILQKNYDAPSLETIEQTLVFFKAEMDSLSPTERTSRDKLERDTLLKLEKHCNRKLLPEVFCLFILSPLTSLKPELLTKIATFFSDSLANLIKAYNLSRLKLENKKIHDYSLFDHAENTLVIMGELKPDIEALLATLLKDLPDNSDFTYNDIKSEFGPDVHDLVKLLNNLKNIRPAGKRESHQKTQKMFLALSEDVRVIIIKISSLIDLLNNIDKIEDRHRTRLANEAMNIYAPIADIISIWRLKWQLEDGAFRYLNPTDYSKIERRFNVEEKKDREHFIATIKEILEPGTKEKNIKCSISGRFKHFYSIHQKMQAKGNVFNKIYDVFALRILVDSVDDCYRMLGLIHSLWRPRSKRIKDYIAAPKSNHYRSLHTTVIGPSERPVEFQIRTHDMDEEAKFGIAAHWQYKNKKSSAPSWVRSLLLERAERSAEHKVWEKINTKVLFDLIFVYTPKGDIISLPRDATPVDFAYHIHTAVGHRCLSAKINNEMALLDTPLKSGDRVEIILNQSGNTVNQGWLKFVKSAIARHAINTYFDKNSDQ
jgi:GTP pyrophosphokinase